MSEPTKSDDMKEVGDIVKEGQNSEPKDQILENKEDMYSSNSEFSKPVFDVSDDDSPLRRAAPTTPITPSKSSIKSETHLNEPLGTAPIDHIEAIGFGSANSSAVKNSPTTHRRRSTSKESSIRSRRNSAHISPTSMIFRNLLIMEDDLRNQARYQKILRWQYTFFVSILAGVAGFSIYELHFSDVVMKGIYRFFLQFTVCFIPVTLALFHLSGQYRRTMIIPKRFYASTNKGIRQFNIRLVKVPSTWDESLTDKIRLLTDMIADSGLWTCEKVLKLGKSTMIVRFWNRVKISGQPRIGATDVKIVLNPRAFSAEIREGWEIYRDEFWAREGARRRKIVNGHKH